jgi:hypothetical protein
LILTSGLSKGAWDWLRTSKAWDRNADKMGSLRVFKNIQEYHSVNLNPLGEARDEHRSVTAELAEMRYGTISDVLSHNNCLFLILHVAHEGTAIPGFTKPMPKMSVTVWLVEDAGRITPLTPPDSQGVPILKSDNENDTWVALGVGISSSDWPEFEHIYSQELQEGTYVCVSIEYSLGMTKILRTWKSGKPPHVDVIASAYST